jgi:uncharacterized protein involved in exopolysaccharide biosynthesis
VVTTTGLPQEIEAGQATYSASSTVEVLELLWQSRSSLWKSAVLGFVIALGIAFLIPKQYESTTRLMPPDTQSLSGAGLTTAVMGNLSPATANLAGNLLGVKSPGALFMGVLQSRTVQDDLINRLDLRQVYGYKRYIDTRKKLANRTAISEDTKSGIITLTVTDNDANRAREMAAGYVDELNILVSQLSTSAARRERLFLEERLQKVKQDLDEATLRLGKFSSENMTFDPQVQGKAMLDAAGTLQGQLIAAESELSGLEQIYGPENSRVKSARARVAELRAKLRGISGRGSGKSDSAQSGDLYPSLEQLPLLGNTYADLARRARIDEAVFEVLTKQYELAKVQEAKEIPTVKVLDVADLPEKKSFPPRLLIAALGGLLGLTLASASASIGIAWVRLDPADPKKRIWNTAMGRIRATRHARSERITEGDVSGGAR